MLEGEKIEENETASASIAVADPPTLTDDEALAKLEDYRCAICQNIIINACRIDCGHTYCRHCLNVDKENRSNGTKPTCFICDAAITEITQNAEVDKEIGDLYAKLPTNERLKRARAKSERKEEEENFRTRPKETHTDAAGPEDEQSSSESIASGDASYNGRLHAEACQWDNFSSESESPSFYGSPCTFRIWHGEQDYSVPQEDDTGERYQYNNEDPDDELRERNIFGCTPPPPMVIHHTIQHVYHTVQVRNSNGESDDGEATSESSSDNGHSSSQQTTDWRHRENVSEMPRSFSTREHLGFQRRSPNQRYQSVCPPFQRSGEGDMHNMHTSSTTGPSFYHQHPAYYGYPSYHPHPGLYSSTLPFSSGSCHNHTLGNSRASASNYCRHQNANSYHNYGPPTIRNIYAASATMREDSENPFHRDPSFYRNVSDEENDDEITLTYPEGDEFRCGCEGLCEFHQRECEQHNSNESVHSVMSSRERSREALSPPYSHSASNNAIHAASVIFAENLEDDSDEEDRVITFSISVPVRDAIERRNSSPALIDMGPRRGIVREQI